MNIRITIMALGILAFTSCHHRESKENSVVEPTQAQQKLLDAGWTNETPDEDMSEDYGVKPIYGIQDNYFDIVMGSGCNVAVKIMELGTDKCIRYVYVAENTTATIYNSVNVFILEIRTISSSLYLLFGRSSPM
jgi:hypothetical protein